MFFTVLDFAQAVQIGNPLSKTQEEVLRTDFQFGQAISISRENGKVTRLYTPYSKDYANLRIPNTIVLAITSEAEKIEDAVKFFFDAFRKKNAEHWQLLNNKPNPQPFDPFALTAPTPFETILYSISQGSSEIIVAIGYLSEITQRQLTGQDFKYDGESFLYNIVRENAKEKARNE